MPAFLIPLIGSRVGQLIAAFLVGFFACFYSIPQVDVGAVTRNAEAGRDAYWQRKQMEANESHEHTLAAAIAERDSTPDVPVSDAELNELCRRSATCRDKAGSGKYRVPGVPADHVGKSRLKANGKAGSRS